MGEHDVIFAGPGERIVVSHIATDRGIFARGALKAALWGQGKPPGSLLHGQRARAFADGGRRPLKANGLPLIHNAEWLDFQGSGLMFRHAKSVLAASVAMLTIFVSVDAIAAEPFDVVSSRDSFVDLVQGRELRRFGIRLTVTPDGEIVGRAFGSEVTGDWDWEKRVFLP